MSAAIVVGDGNAAADTNSAGFSAVSAVSGGDRAPANAEQVPAVEESDGGSALSIVAGVAALGAVLGIAGAAPFAVRRLRARS
jgi:hypothetical protein